MPKKKPAKIEVKPKEVNKGGRPRKEIDIEDFENLCALQCTKQEICDWFDLTDKTLERWCKDTYENRGFSEVFAQKRGRGRVSLRRNQWQLSKTNVAMAIWLGKNWLGQSDNPTTGDPVERSQGMADMIKQLKEKVFGITPKTD